MPADKQTALLEKIRAMSLEELASLLQVLIRDYPEASAAIEAQLREEIRNRTAAG